MNDKIIITKITGLKVRPVIYVSAGIFLLATGIIDKDSTIAFLSLLFLYQGIFNTCLFGSCRVLKR
jgi:uncharacterized protein (AIM24 family)